MAARKFAIPKVLSADELLHDPDVEVVLNLTIPQAHHELTLAAIRAGKHVYSEKPFSLNRVLGRRLMRAAQARGVRIGSAPDTFLGAGCQTSRKLIDEGAIGRPIAGVANMMMSGHEAWHPDPDFCYQPGGGPMFDMGPYYLTHLVNLLGPVRRVTGATGMTYRERTITSQPRAGQIIRVEVPTCVTGILHFENGAIVNITTSFDVHAAQVPVMQIYGTEGTLNVPDPGTFGGTPYLWRLRDPRWQPVPLEFAYAEHSRGLGVADMAAAIESGRPHRANSDLAFHVLDVMEAIHDASDKGRHIMLKSHCERPAPMPPSLKEGQIDP